MDTGSPPLLDRLAELRTASEAGPRAAAFAEELSSLVRDVLPLLSEIDGSLRESADQMPAAALQIQSVTEATEVATTEILDLVDAVRDRLAPAAEAPGGAAADRLRRLLRDRLADAGLLADAEALLDEADAARDARAEADAERLAGVRSDLDRILVSLQVQDITAQQLASATHLIESVRYRLDRLVRWVSAEGGAAPDDGPAGGPPADDGTFDADARYVRPASLQGDVGRAAAEVAASGDGASGRASQGDIDALFGA